MENCFKKHPNIVTLVAIVLSGLVLYFSLIEQEKLPNVEIKFIDKAIHICFYFVLFIFYKFGFFRNFKEKSALLNSVLLTFSFGFIIEIFQGTITQTRQFDLVDILANFIGISISYFVLRLLRTKKSKL